MSGSQSTLTGKVDRISSSGNAIVSRGSSHINLGPLPQEVVGEKVRFSHEGGNYGFCINVQYIDQEYFEEMAGKCNISSNAIKPDDFPVNINLSERVNSDDIFLAEYLFSPPSEGSNINIQDNQFLVKLTPINGGQWYCLGVVNEPIVRNELLPVIITDIYSTYVETKGVFHELEHELPDIGEIMTTTTGLQHEKGTLAVYEGDYSLPVLIEDAKYPSGDSLELEVTGVKHNYLTGEAAFSVDDFDSTHVCDSNIPDISHQSQNRVIKQGIPVDIEPVPADAPTTTEVIATDKNPEALVGRWNIQKKIGPVDITRGDEIDLEICSVNSDSCIGYYDRFPVRVEFETDIPSELETECISVSVQAVHLDKAIAEPRRIKELQGKLKAQVVGTAAGDAIAISDGHIVQIPTPSIKPVPADAPTTTEVIVTNESSETLVGRWNIEKEIGPIDITRGDKIDLEIRSVDDNSCIGYHNRFPVRVEFETDIPSELETECISVSVQTAHPDKAIAEPRWIKEPQGKLKAQVVGTAAGDAIAISDGHIVQIPTPSIKPVPADAPTTTEVIVADEGSEAFVGRWNIEKEIGPIDITRGDKINLEICSVDDNSCIGYHNRFPVRVEFETDIPSGLKSERISVSVQTVHPDKAIAEPRWVEESQEPLEVRVAGNTAGDAIAISDGHLIRIPNSSVVESGDRLVAGTSKSKNNDVIIATVSARPVFQKTEGPNLIRLPQTRGDVVQAGDTPAVVDHLPDVDSAVTLGVQEVNEDHIVPTVTALPGVHMPPKGDSIFMQIGGTSDATSTGTAEELPVKLISQFRMADFVDLTNNNHTVRVYEQSQSVICGIIDDNYILSTYRHLQSANSALQRCKYQDAIQDISVAIQSCPSPSLLKRLLTVRKIAVQALISIQANSSLSDTADAASAEAKQLHNFSENKDTTAEVDALLKARESEMQVVESLLTILSGVTNDTSSNMQPILQGVNQKSLRFSPLILTAKQHIADIENIGTETSFKQQIPSAGLCSIIEQFNNALPVTAEQFQLPDPSEDNTDWLQPLLQMRTVHHDMKSDNIDADSDVDVNDWERPATPETMGVTPIEEVGDNGNTSITQGSDSGTTTGEQTSTSGSDSEDRTEAIPTGGTSPDTTTPGTNETTTGSGTSTEGSPKTNVSTMQELRKRAEEESSDNPKREDISTSTTISRYKRSSAVREYALARAGGTCEVCEEDAPFFKENGDPYLEVHHVNELSDGGADDPSIVGAVCPSCHKEIHYGRHGDELNKELRERLQAGLGDVGVVDE